MRRQTADPVRFAERVLGFAPDAAQREILRNAESRTLLNACRQWGKTTTAAALAAHRLVTGAAESVTLILTPSARQSAEILRLVEDLALRAGATPVGASTRLLLSGPGGARVVGLGASESSVRGAPRGSLLVIDEAARVSDAAYKAARPLVTAGGGSILALSTPFGPRGFFWREWTRGGSRWRRYRLPATACPRFSPEFLGEEREAVGDPWFRQEYLCEFTNLRGGLFPLEWIVRAFRDDVPPLELP
ncbi:MAG: hypothetical protein IPM24_09485 [Bryobacterales bacterium]|nr:hypothetical protein [Bryobacterales bacterium]